MIDIMVENWPNANQHGGFFFRMASTVFFANTSAGVEFGPWEKVALARIAASKDL